MQTHPFLAEMLPQVLTIVVPILGTLLTWLIHSAVARMQAGTGKDVAIEVATGSDIVVLDLNQRVTSKNGKLTAEDAKDLKELAIRTLRDQLSNAALAWIQKNSAHVDDVLGRNIEAAVARAKSASAATPVKT